MAFGVRNLLFFVIVVGCHNWRTEATSHKVLTFVSMMNGYFGNLDIVKEEKKLGLGLIHPVVNDTLIPVDLPALEPAISIYFREFENNELTLHRILAISEDEAGLINMASYDLMEISSNPLSSEEVTHLKDLKRKEKCDSKFKRIENDVFLGTIPDCGNFPDDEIPPRTTTLLTCNTVTDVVLYASALQKVNYIPNKIARYGERLPLSSQMLRDAGNFHGPCLD